MSSDSTTFDAIVLAGGRSSRLGVDKATVQLGDRTLLQRALAAVSKARNIVIVGPDALAVEAPGVRIVREDPPWGGPVAAIAAGLAALPDGQAADSWVLVLACDLPRAADAVALLVAQMPPSTVDGCHLVDSDGHPQWLVGLYRRRALTGALAQGPAEGASMRSLLAPLTLSAVTDVAGVAADVDTPDDLARARRAVDEGDWT